MIDPLRIDELTHSEEPAALQLQRLGLTFVPCETLDMERASMREAILRPRLETALLRLNPWVPSVTSADATDSASSS